MNRPSKPSIHRLSVSVFTLALCASGALSVQAEEPEWKSKVSEIKAGDFPMLPSCEITFNMGWKDVVNAAQMKLTFVAGDQIKTNAKSGSIGSARSLFAYDSEFVSLVDGSSLTPIAVEQSETDPFATDTYEVAFTDGMIKNQWNTIPKDTSKEKEERSRTYELPNAFDIISAALYIRSQKLADGESHSVIVFPYRDPYLVTVTVGGRGKKTFEGAEIDALRLDVKASKIEKDGSLDPLTDKVKSASFWLSDDDRRLPLGLNIEIIAGTAEVALAEFKPQ